MTTRTIDEKHLPLQSLATNTSKSNQIPREVPSTSLSLQSPALPSEWVPSTNSSMQNISTRTEVTPKTRILVVRTSSRTQNNDQKFDDAKQEDEADDVKIPPAITDGHTSVYLIRRPIPPTEPPRITRYFKADNNGPQQVITTNTTETTRRVPNNENEQPIIPSASTVQSLTSPSQTDPSFKRPKTSKHRSSLTTVDNSKEDSLDFDLYESSKDHIISPTQIKTVERNKYRPKSGTKDQGDSEKRNRSISRRQRNQRRISPTQSCSPIPPLISDQNESNKNNDGKKGFYSLSKPKQTPVQADVIPHETAQNEHQTDGKTRPLPPRGSKRRRTPSPRIKSSKSIVLVNPHDQTIAVVENPYAKGNSLTSFIHDPPPRPKKHQLLQTSDTQYTSTLPSKSQGSSCLDCLSKHICLIITICVTLCIIGIAGAGVSAYFLATNFNSNFKSTIVGIIVGGVLAIVSLCFLYCVLGCIGSRDGYFTYNDNGRNSSGRAFALMPPNHQNAHLYTYTDNHESYKVNQAPSLKTQVPVANRQKTTVNDTNSKNIIIEMPERLLTARQHSPKSREIKMTHVVNNIGRVVEDAKKRYNGDVPNKVIVTVDENAKPKT